MAIQPGTDIGRYHILEQLGEGGMAVVYKAYDTRLENEVAVKLIRIEALSTKNIDVALKRFQMEAKKMAQLTHPNIVPVMDYGDYEGSPYIVMRYLPGGTLKEKLGMPMPWQDAINILKPIVDAAAYAHGKGLIHRDIKPSNILITETGEPMLTDFGIAKILTNEETLDLTVTGMGMGTPEYMAPEQAEGQLIDKRADIYSLGIVLYEMVAGRKPFIADTPIAVIVKQIHDPLPPLMQYINDIPKEVERLIYKALAKDPDDRYADMGAFAKALQNLLKNEKTYLKEKSDHIVPEKEYAPKEKPTHVKKEKKPFDTRWLIGAMGAIGLGLVIFAGIKLVGGRSEPKLMVSEKDGMTLVYVPKGEFEMGSEDGDSDEQPVHTVFLDAFWIDQAEVTNAQYELCVSDGSCDIPNNTTFYNDSEYSDHPVVYVNWYDASDYCQWAGRRLPTEAQWEKAARGTDDRTYPWGEGITCSQANFSGCRDFLRTSPVGYYREKGASPYGAYDMAGNVWEWVADWYADDYYQGSPSDNPTGPDNGSYRVLRGGSWSIIERNVRSASRYNFNPDLTLNFIGFRCARLP